MQGLLGQGGVDRMKKVQKALNLLRKMDYWERMILFDWLRDWFEYEIQGEDE